MLSGVPFVIAHRGASGTAPENTVAAIRRAHDLGARWIEVDVQCAAGGIPVVIHDHTLERTTDGRGPVVAQTVEDLARLDAGGWFHRDFAGARVPSLADVLDCCAELGLGINVELKPAPRMEQDTAVAAAALLADWPHPLLVSSFSIPALSAFHAGAPDAALGALFGAPPEPGVLAALPLPLFAVNLSVRTTGARNVAIILDQGYSVLVYTVNDLETARRLHGWGVSAVFTDFPERLLPPAAS